MKEISEEQKKEVWDEVRAEFPGDELMQEIHFIRLMHYLRMKDLPPEERKNFFRRAGNENSFGEK